MLPLPAAGAGATGDTAMSSTQHQLIEQCATRLRGIVEALDNIHDTSPHRWSTDLDDVHSSAESLLALIKDQAPTQAAQGLAGAALAQPSPKREQRLVECDACPTSGGCVEKCMKAPTQPSPAQTQPSPAPTLRAAIDVANARFEVPVAKWGTNLVGEEEQPEVVARVDGTDEDWFIQPEDETELHNEGLLFAGCELGRMIDFDRIVGALRADRDSWAEQAEQRLADWDEMRKERDTALANVDSLAVQVLKLGGTISFAHHRTDQAGQVPQAWLDVQAERRRQVEAEGWTPEHDDEHDNGEMARAAACYALAGSSAPNDGTAALLVSLAWPWDQQWWKPTSARRDLVKSCALALAEIERLDRAGISQSPQPGATTASS